MYGPVGWLTPHVWLGFMRPRSQCVGGMLLVDRSYKHVLNKALRKEAQRKGSVSLTPAAPQTKGGKTLAEWMAPITSDYVVRHASVDYPQHGWPQSPRIRDAQ